MPPSSLRTQAPSESAGPPRRRRALADRGWLAFAVLAGLLPVCGVLVPSRVFYIRDLSLFFWGRHLFFRRSLFSGEWPLWDPFMGAGQSAVADALNQMFLLPVLLLRLVGTEIVGFNLWVALPFPLAALGAYLFFRSRFSARAAALGATVLATCGPIVSTGNCPNLSWSVAAMPWVMWGVDRVLGSGSPRAAAGLALLFAFQALAGEPVTMVATGMLAVCYASVQGVAEPRGGRRAFAGRWLLTVGGLCLGGLLSAVQMVPLADAVRDSWRPFGLSRDFWSLHPLTLLESVYLHLFGNYFEASYLGRVPWLPALYSGREPFFYSNYVGVATLTLALLGLVRGRDRWWAWFWGGAALVGVFFAFGSYTAVYPFVRSLVPFLASFRFPVKYLVVAGLALAALVAAAFDELDGWEARRETGWRDRFARWLAVAGPVAVGGTAWAAWLACLFATTPTAFQLHALAKSLRIADPVGAAEYMLRTLPDAAALVMGLSAAAALLLVLATSRRREARLARHLLFALAVVDLLVHAWPINPTFDASYYREPRWIAAVRAHPESRFYLGGKFDGTLNVTDPDSSHGLLSAPGLKGSASRAALSVQAAFYPSGYQARELFSYDLAVLWPRPYQLVHQRFLDSTREERARFLDATGARFRLLPPSAAGARQPIVQVPYFMDLYLYDFGGTVGRVGMRSRARVEPNVLHQIEESFQAQFVDPGSVTLEQELPAAGTEGVPVDPFARLTIDRANRVAVECGAGPGGGYLLLLDSYSPDWRVTVDGQPSTMARANALFRAVHLRPGRHVVVFDYRPFGFLWGAAVSAATSLLVAVLLAWRRKPASREQE